MKLLPRVVQTLITGTPDATRVRDGLTAAVQPTLDFLNTYFKGASNGSLQVLRDVSVQGAFTVAKTMLVNAALNVYGDVAINGNFFVRTRTGNGVVIIPQGGTPAFYITNAAGNQALFLVYADGTFFCQGANSANGFAGTLDCGNYWNTSAAANTMYLTAKACVNANNGSLGGTPFYFKFPRPGSIVGYSITNAGPITTGANYISYYKNGNQIVNFNAGTGGNNASFWGTHLKGAYQFAAGDTLQTAVGITVAGNYQASLILDIEMSA